MALEFRRRRFYRPGKKGQLALAIAALLLALCIATLWMIVHFHNDRTPSASESSDEESLLTEDFTEQDTAAMLIIFDEPEHEQFTLIQADPEDGVFRTVTVPPSLATSKNNTLVDVYRKSGAGAAVSAVVDELGLPVRHYVAVSGEEAASWFNYLESGVAVTLDKAVDITDANGSIVRLDAGEHTLNGTQIASLLRNSGRKNGADAEFPARLTAAMLDQYLHEDRYLSRDFTQLANLSKTSLRIGDFNDYRSTLEHLASKNENGTCEVISLYGNDEDNCFIFDKKETARRTDLYE